MYIKEVSIKENSELRSLARDQLKGNWGTAVLLCLIYTIIVGVLSATLKVIPVIGYLANFIIAGPFALGLIICFMKLVRNEPFRFENLFDGFSRFGSAFLTQLLTGIFVLLWSILLVIPGIIASFRYAMAFYILNDNPEMSAMESISASKEMMKGYKWKLFCMYFSFIGWAFLSVLTIGIGYLWLKPYMNASTANFYQNLKDVSSEKDELIFEN